MIYNFGSINVDHVYRVPTLPKPGETITARSVEDHLGGKGINQSIAISKAGGKVCHIGAVGADGEWALSQIRAAGIDTKNIANVPEPTGHAVINVDEHGENAIVIFGGANQALTKDQVDAALANAGVDDWVLLQNETNLSKEIATAAKDRGCKLAYSAAPFVAESVLSLIDHTDLLVVNEGESDSLANELGVEVDNIPVSELVVTRGSAGAKYRGQQGVIEQAAFSVDAVDTTGAGDTFLGSFLALYSNQQNVAAALEYASAASALQVTKPGASTAIPTLAEVKDFMEKYV